MELFKIDPPNPLKFKTDLSCLSSEHSVPRIQTEVQKITIWSNVPLQKVEGQIVDNLTNLYVSNSNYLSLFISL